MSPASRMIKAAAAAAGHKPWTARNFFMVELMRCFGYFKRENTLPFLYTFEVSKTAR